MRNDQPEKSEKNKTIEAVEEEKVAAQKTENKTGMKSKAKHENHEDRPIKELNF